MHPAIIALIIGIPAVLFISALVLMIRRAFVTEGAKIKGITDSRGQIISYQIWFFCGCLFFGIGLVFTIYGALHPEARLLRYSIPLLGFGYASFHAFRVFRKRHNRQRA